MANKLTGKVKLINLQHIEWEITNFVVISDEDVSYKSPTYFLEDGTSFYLKLCPNPKFSACLSLSVIPQKYVIFFTECTLRYRKMDGHLTILKGLKRKDFCGVSYAFGLPTLEQFMSVLPSSGDVIITCICQFEIRRSVHLSFMDELRSRKLTKLDTLSWNFRDLFLNETSCDITLFVKEKEYKAHKAVLIARSSVFAAMFQHETSEKQTGIVTITDCDPVSFQQFLEFLYCGRIEKVSFDSAVSLYETSNKYNVQELLEFCRNYLRENLSITNALDVAILADTFDDLMLIPAAQYFFNGNTLAVKRSSEWKWLLKCNRRLAKELSENKPKMKYLSIDIS